MTPHWRSFSLVYGGMVLNGKTEKRIGLPINGTFTVLKLWRTLMDRSTEEGSISPLNLRQKYRSGWKKLYALLGSQENARMDYGDYFATIPVFGTKTQFGRQGSTDFKLTLSTEICGLLGWLYGDPPAGRLDFAPRHRRPPQPLDEANQAAADAATAIHQLERDKPLSQIEWNDEEVYRSRYVRKNRRIG
jgi:hypothetical protein